MAATIPASRAIEVPPKVAEAPLLLAGTPDGLATGVDLGLPASVGDEMVPLDLAPVAEGATGTVALPDGLTAVVDAEAAVTDVLDESLVAVDVP